MKKKVENLQKQLEIAKQCLKMYGNRTLWNEKGDCFMTFKDGYTYAQEALERMEGCEWKTKENSL